MNLVLNRKKFGTDGIFGELYDEKGNFLFYTLEHSYNGVAKIAEGTYECSRGEHSLKSDPEKKFWTFEVMDVPPFQGQSVHGVLFHILNFNDESEGCIGLGMSLGFRSNGVDRMLTYSGKAFNAFMKMQDGIDTFYLVVSNYQ